MSRVYQNPPNPKLWPRFRRYSQFIRILEMNHYSSIDFRVVADADAIARLHDAKLLPNLSVLKLGPTSGELRLHTRLLIPLLASSGLVSFKWCLDRRESPFLLPPLELLYNTTESLREICIHSNSFHGDQNTLIDWRLLGGSMERMIHSMDRLVSLSLDPGLLYRSGVWRALGDLPSLQNLSVDLKTTHIYDLEHIFDISNSSLESEPRFRPDSFHELRSISLPLTVQGVQDLLTRNVPPNLHTIRLRLEPVRIRDPWGNQRSPSQERTLSLPRILSSISLLEKIEILVPENTLLSFNEPVGFNSQFIKSIHIVSEVPLSFTDDDVALLTSCLPQLVDLQLSPCPLSSHHTVTSRLTLCSLPIISENCPKLEKLGLCLDGTSPPPTIDLDWHPFHHLASLDFGRTSMPRLNDRVLLVFFIGFMCPLEGCIIKARTTKDSYDEFIQRRFSGPRSPQNETPDPGTPLSILSAGTSQIAPAFVHEIDQEIWDWASLNDVVRLYREHLRFAVGQKLKDTNLASVPVFLQ
jgi:hypothetical protein